MQIFKWISLHIASHTDLSTTSIVLTKEKRQSRTRFCNSAVIVWRVAPDPVIFSLHIDICDGHIPSEPWLPQMSRRCFTEVSHVRTRPWRKHDFSTECNFLSAVAGTHKKNSSAPWVETARWEGLRTRGSGCLWVGSTFGSI